jgi:hypothetical protein
MPRKSRAFVDKKSATKFTLVHRSQKDVNKDSETHTDLVLRPILKPGESVPTHLNLDPAYVDLESASEAPAFPYPGGPNAGAAGGDDDEYYDEDGEYYDEDGEYYDEDGEYYDEDGEYYDEDDEEEQPAATAAYVSHV